MKVIKAALAGNPNCGKTTIFNVLTGARQKVGNWPGVTIEKKFGKFKLDEQTQIELVDLPGIYSLEQDEIAIDEKIARDFLNSGEVDFIINVLDATCLDRQLLLTHQLREYGYPMLTVVNMMDVAKANGLEVDIKSLSASIGTPVIGIAATQSTAAKDICSALPQAFTATKAKNAELTGASVERITQRLAMVNQWLQAAVSQQPVRLTATERVDAIVLNRFLGVPIFLLMMYLLFTFAINIGAVFIDFFDILLGAWLVDGVHSLLAWMQVPTWVSVLLADGVGGGIQLVGTFIPVIGFLYLGLSLLEESGYIVRAAFVVDRLMRAIGLPGKAFVPLIVGFGCNVPAVMATRTMSCESDRIVTTAMTPFMSCGARLPVYALFAAALFSTSGQNVVFGLYLLGIVAAIFTGWFFRKALFKDELSSSIMEMPVYHRPSVRNILMTTWHRLRGFVEKASKTIVTVVVILSFLNSWGTDGSFGNEDSQQSVLSAVSKMVTPVLKPLGVQEENWPATVGIVTGIFAKEAVVGTLDALYAEVSGENADNEESASLWGSTAEAFVSIWVNTLDLTGAFADPLGITITSYDSLKTAAEDQGVRGATLSTMARLFVTPFAAFCYLILILMYTPCVAAMGALVREAGAKWGWVVIGWSTILAYATAVTVYQAGTIMQHPMSSALWIAFMALSIVLFYQLLVVMGRKESERYRKNLIPTRSI